MWVGLFRRKKVLPPQPQTKSQIPNKLNKTCSMCGKSGLYWWKVEGEVWRLFDNGVMHKCPNYKYEDKQ